MIQRINTSDIFCLRKTVVKACITLSTRCTVSVGLICVSKHVYIYVYVYMCVCVCVCVYVCACACVFVCINIIVYKCVFVGAVAKSLANVLIGTRFASWYWLQPRAGF